MKDKAVVYREHTLGCLFENEGLKTLQVLRSSVLKGAPFSVHDEPIIGVQEGDYRQATRKDFDDYRVQWHPDYLVSDQVEAEAAYQKS